MLKAIVADKNKKVRQAVVSILSDDLHVKVSEVSSARRLLASIEKAHPALLLVDFDMVSAVGVARVKELRGKLPDMNVLLLVPAERQGKELRDLLVVGATDFLSKPFDRVQLLHRVRVLDAVMPFMGIMASATLEGSGTEVVLRQLHDIRSGRIDFKKVATFLGLPVKTLAEGLGRNYRAVHKTPSSVSLQPDLQTLRRIIELLLDLVGTKESALVWLNTPSPDLAGETPIRLITSGHAESVGSLLENVAAGAPS